VFCEEEQACNKQAETKAISSFFIFKVQSLGVDLGKNES
jgi:hypothetical protein